VSQTNAEEVFAGRVSDFDDDTRRVVRAGGREVVVFRHRDRFYAFENVCLHQGGPVGEGLLIGKVEAVLGPDRTYQGERFSEEVTHLVCPWHGWEYDIATGACAGDPRRKLRRFRLVEREDGVYVVG
jgi:nitrite reductase (NADH) small subunit